jgi:hypothetical protein
MWCAAAITGGVSSGSCRFCRMNARMRSVRARWRVSGGRARRLPYLGDPGRQQVEDDPSQARRVGRPQGVGLPVQAREEVGEQGADPLPPRQTPGGAQLTLNNRDRRSATPSATRAVPPLTAPRGTTIHYARCTRHPTGYIADDSPQPADEKRPVPDPTHATHCVGAVLVPVWSLDLGFEPPGQRPRRPTTSLDTCSVAGQSDQTISEHHRTGEISDSRAADSVRSGKVDAPTPKNERFRRSEPC